VIVNYDINDYKEKTELDRTKLFTTTFAALRAYRDIMKVEEARRAAQLPRRPGARDRRLGPHLPAAQPERLRQRPAAAGGGAAAPGTSMLLRLRGATAISGENDYEILAQIGDEEGTLLRREVMPSWTPPRATRSRAWRRHLHRLLPQQQRQGLAAGAQGRGRNLGDRHQAAGVLLRRRHRLRQHPAPEITDTRPS
jgi:hypothetical protein